MLRVNEIPDTEYRILKVNYKSFESKASKVIAKKKENR